MSQTNICERSSIFLNVSYYPGLKCVCSSITDFIKDNKKIVLSLLFVFLVSFTVGILIAVKTVGGDFVTVPRSEMEFGAVKVFFLSSVFLLIGYGILIVSTAGGAWVFVCGAPFVVLGIFFGEYVCILIAKYEMIGIFNLLIVYVPFYMVSFICMLVAATRGQRHLVGCGSGCKDSCRSSLKPGCVALCKIYLINIGANFTFFVLIGSFVKVIVVSLN